MGYDRHHAIVITSYLKGTIEKIHEEAAALCMTVSGIVRSPMNNWFTFLIAPDGSKEGWPDSALGDEQREKLIRYMDTFRYEDGSSPVDWVEVQYGDDERETRVVVHSDEAQRPSGSREGGWRWRVRHSAHVNATSVPLSGRMLFVWM